MRITIECKEATVGIGENNRCGTLYDFFVETTACDCYKELADTVAMEAVAKLKRGANND